MEPVHDLPLEPGPAFQLNNANIFPLRAPLQHRFFTKMSADVTIRNKIKYYYVQIHNVWFTYIDDKTIGDQIDEPVELEFPLAYSPYATKDMDLVLIENRLYYMSKERKFYSYNPTTNHNEVPEPYWHILLKSDLAWSRDGVYSERHVKVITGTILVKLYHGSILKAFDEYNEEVVWDCRRIPLMYNRLPINLTEFNAEKGGFTSLPLLPASLKILRCHRNQLTSLPPLPPNLEILSCGRNKLTALPPLPAGLKELSFAYNQVSGLTALPAGLQKFIGDSNPLRFLPVLPSGLYTLSCKNTQIKCLPTLPNTLGLLDCSHNDLGVLPSLPEGLDTLWCTNCRLTKLPDIPEFLTRLDYSHNRIRRIVDFPYWVVYYKCSYNFIEGFDSFRDDSGCPCCDRIMKKRHLDNLVEPVHKHYPFNFKSPRELMRFDCSHNPIKAFPAFPDELRKLNCSYTRIQSLPDLPADLHHLDCSYTPLLKLPALPRHVTHLDCSSTLVRTLPELEILPFRFGSLSCYNTRLDQVLMRYIDRGDLDSVNYYTFAQRHKEQLKKDVRPVLNLWIALGCEKGSEYMDTDHGILPAEITRIIAMFLCETAIKQPVAEHSSVGGSPLGQSLAAIVAKFRAHVLEPIVRPEEIQ